MIITNGSGRAVDGTGEVGAEKASAQLDHVQTTVVETDIGAIDLNQTIPSASTHRN